MRIEVEVRKSDVLFFNLTSLVGELPWRRIGGFVLAIVLIVGMSIFQGAEVLGRYLLYFVVAGAFLGFGLVVLILYLLMIWSSLDALQPTGLVSFEIAENGVTIDSARGRESFGWADTSSGSFTKYIWMHHNEQHFRFIPTDRLGPNYDRSKILSGIQHFANAA